MHGSTENRRKIASIRKLDNANPPNKLPHIPPKAIADQDNDWRSPAYEALTNKSKYLITQHKKALCKYCINYMHGPIMLDTDTR